MENNRIIIWSDGIDDFILGKNSFGGGITVQMYFWAKTFLQDNWAVYSISKNSRMILEGIQFIKIPTKKKIGIFVDFLLIFYYLLKIRPQVVFRRGASRNLGFVAFWAKILKIKVVFLCASDTDFDIGNEIINYEHDKKIFRYGIKKTEYFIVQNTLQKMRLRVNYNKNKILIVPNIWCGVEVNNTRDFQQNGYVLWVSNFFHLKRPEWFIQLSETMPDQKFVMVGGPGNNDLYQKCKSMANKRTNLSFLGPKSFSNTNTLFAQAKLFICCSEFEGFPNTFLQAWSNNIPVISSVDPSNIIQNQKLGVVVENVKEIKDAIVLMRDEKIYRIFQNNIQKYFNQNHNGNFYYRLVVKKFNLKILNIEKIPESI